MINFFKRASAEHDKHAAGGCGCGSGHAHDPATDAATHGDEGCRAGRGADAAKVPRPSAKTQPHDSHGGCCGGRSATSSDPHRAAPEPKP